MENLLFTPPIVFMIFIVVFLAFSRFFPQFESNKMRGERGMDAYACGQRNIQNYVNPDYSQYFPFAFFFTIMHVLVLVVATAPYDAPILPVLYIASGILAMLIIFKR